MNDRPEPAADEEPPRRKYEKPRLIEYGHVARLTQSGGLSTKDFGNMMRP
jgi:hypothetical protein